MSKKDIFDNYTIRHAQVFDDNRLIFAVSEKVHDWKMGDDPAPVSFAIYDAKKDEWDWQPTPSNDIAYTATTGLSVDGNLESIFVDHDNNVAIFQIDAPENNHTYKIPYDDIVTSQSICCIGNHYYLCGSQQTVLRFNSASQRERLHFKKGGRRAREKETWYAIDGFSEDDIYTTGKDIGQGSLFHFDGVNWHTMKTPDNWKKFSGRALCCAPNGFVYAATLDGGLIKGNAKRGWETVVHPDDSDISEIFSDMAMVYFKGRIYV